MLVLNGASPQFADAALQSKAIIVQSGSQLAHLVIVSREAQVPVVLVEDALTHFPLGCDATLDFNAKTIASKAKF